MGSRPSRRGGTPLAPGTARVVVGRGRRQSTTNTTTEEVVSQTATPAKKGSFGVLASIPETVSNVLGRGYRIEGDYANSNSLADPVFDIKKINEYGRLECNTTQDIYDGGIFKGEGSEEYKKSVTSSLNVKVSASGWGAAFSSEVNKTFSEDRSSKQEYKFITIKDTLRYAIYRVQGYGFPADLSGFLCEEFLADLDCRTGYELVKKYGTHVVLGMQVGARLFYNMSYKHSLSSYSKASTFSTKTSLSYNQSTGGPKGAEQPKKSNYEQAIEKVLNGSLKDDKVIKELTALIKASEESKKNATAKTGTDSKPAGGGKGFSFSASVETNQTSNESGSTEASSTEVKVRGIGGDIRYFKLIEEDPNQFTPWLESVNKSNAAWCDFVEDTLIPLYELIPAGHKLTAADVKKGWEQYLLEKCPKTQPLGKDTLYGSVNMSGGSIVHNYGKNVLHNGNDGEISTSKGKRTGWRIKLQLVNVEDTVGVNVSYLIFEGGEGANRSVLHLYDTYYLPKKTHARVAVDPSVGSGILEFSGTYTGQQHHYFDVSNEARQIGCPWIDLNSGLIAIRIDGSGDDYGNVGIMFDVKVPVITYAE